MLHILLFILKIIGILLLSILGLILLILALVLLVPVRYRAGLQMRTIADYSADGKVSWLLGLICLTGGYDGEQVKLDIRIFGHSLLHKKPKKQKKKRKKPPKRPTEEQPAARKIQAEKEEIEPENTECAPIIEQDWSEQDEKTSVQEISVAEDGGTDADETEISAAEDGGTDADKTEISAAEDSGTDADKTEISAAEDSGTDADEVEQISGTHEKNHIWQKLRNGFMRLSRLPSQIGQKVSSIGHIWKNLSKRKDHLQSTVEKYHSFWNRTCTQAAKDHILKEVKYLLRHILPRKLEGILTFGFEDPATTGQVLGILCVLTVFTGNHLEVNGNFEGKMLEGDVSIKGHVRLCHIAKSAISLLIDKNIRKTIKEFRRLMA